MKTGRGVGRKGSHRKGSRSRLSIRGGVGQGQGKLGPSPSPKPDHDSPTRLCLCRRQVGRGEPGWGWAGASEPGGGGVEQEDQDPETGRGSGGAGGGVGRRPYFCFCAPSRIGPNPPAPPTKTGPFTEVWVLPCAPGGSCSVGGFGQQPHLATRGSLLNRV